MTRDIATILLNLIADLDGTKIADLLMRGNKLFGEEFANAGV